MRNAIFSLLLLGCLFSCTAKRSTANTNSTLDRNISSVVSLEEGIVHTVLFWYAEDADPKRLTEFEKDLKDLGKISSISSYYYGPPAPTAKRGPVDHSYDMAVNVFFKDLAAHDAYQIDPIHLRFVDNSKDLWAKVVIYDNQIKQ